MNEQKLAELNIPISEHDKLPDIILYDDKDRRLYLFEAVTSHGPVTPKRLIELENKFKDCILNKTYVTAFPDFAEFRKHITEIAWETDVWVLEVPDHIIHYNGRRHLDSK